MSYLSNKMAKILERLAEMFPTNDYQQRFESYLSRHAVDHVSQLEKLQQDFDRDQAKGYSWH